MKFRIRRLCADLTDLVLCVLGAGLVSVLPAYLASGLRLGKTVMLILCAVMAYIFFLFRDFMGRSIGKKLFRLKVVSWEGKNAGPWQRLRRNLTLLLFPVEILLILAGYDTLGDNLALTCVSELSSNTVPGMKKGNAVMRTICLTLLLSVLLCTLLFWAVNSLRITGSEGYDAIEEYMSSQQIRDEFGSDPLWSVEEMKKEGDKIVYTLSVNSRTLELTAVKILDEWFVYGLQSESVEKLEKLINKTANENTERYALADINGDSAPELLEYFKDENGAHINIYDLSDPSNVLCVDTGSHAGYTRGMWRVYKDTDDIRGRTFLLVGLYSSYTEQLSKKTVCTVTDKEGVLEGKITFSESVETLSGVDPEGNEIKSYVSRYSYNGIEMPHADYFGNYDSFFSKYQPVSEVIAFEKWEAPESGENAALIMAVKLVKKGWDYTESPTQ